jgi:guanine deaminase
MSSQPEDYIEKAIELAVHSVQRGGGPFAAVIVQDSRVIATGVNSVTGSNDPTAHAEVVAIRAACHTLSTFQLTGCEIYCSCEPCPMCLGAIYWARLSKIYFAANRNEAAAAAFDDSFIYNELSLAPERRSIVGVRLPSSNRLRPFSEWSKTADRVLY